MSSLLETSNDDVSPRAFISHASNDKERFVIPFATQLRGAGVDAWVDKWEMGPGDSLVDRIFEEGIALADAFVVVLSHVSVTKPWVREELNAGVVARINSGREKRLIPVILDADVVVPVALRHLLWVSVPERGLTGAVQETVDIMFGRTDKPPLGAQPAYVRRAANWTGDPADDAVLQLIVNQLREWGPNVRGYSDDIQSAALEVGIGRERFRESMHALTARGLIDAQPIGEARWTIRPLPDRVWLRVEDAAGVDLDAIRAGLLAAIVNGGQRTFSPTEMEVSPFTLGALLREFQRDKLLTVSAFLNGPFQIRQVGPLASRALRDLN